MTTNITVEAIKKNTGFKFSEHLNDVDSNIEEFNNWINRNNLVFSINNKSESVDNFVQFINELTDWNTCDCCGMIERSDNLIWVASQDFPADELDAANFACSTIGADALCEICMSAVMNRTRLNLHEIVKRINENKMIYRVGDLVVLENKDIEEESLKTYIDYIVSMDEEKQTYKLQEYGDKEFVESDFYDMANEAYVEAYASFVEDNFSTISDEVKEWKELNEGGIPKIGIAFENFGFKNEFIAYLKANDLPYGKLLTPKFAIGDTFEILDYYKEGEITVHEIAIIDTSFEEDYKEIVYWDNNHVYIVESELMKQKSLSKDIDVGDEIQIVKNDILHNLFQSDNNLEVPTFTELHEAKKILPSWQLCEKYEDYSYDSIIQEVNEFCKDFFITLEVVETTREKSQKNKKYIIRQTVEFGVPIEVICELQELFDRPLDSASKLIVLQDNRKTEDYSSIEIILQDEIEYEELSTHLKAVVDLEYHDEIDMLIDCIKEAKADKHEVLHVYDC